MPSLVCKLLEQLDAGKGTRGYSAFYKRITLYAVDLFQKKRDRDVLDWVL
jgi:hypothetical protein